MNTTATACQLKSKGVYKISFDNSDRVYIGSTCASFQERWNRHERDLKKKRHSNPILQNVFNKHQSNTMHFTILCALEDKKAILKEEEAFIDRYKNVSCNICTKANSTLGLKWSIESKMKRRGSKNPMWKMGHLRTGAKNPMWGKRHTPEAKLAISKAFRGENHPKAKLTNSKVAKIRTMYESGKYTQKELASLFGVSRSSIRNIANFISWK